MARGKMVKTVGRRSLEIRPEKDGKVKLVIWIERQQKYRVLAQPVMEKAEALTLRDELTRVLAGK